MNNNNEMTPAIRAAKIKRGLQRLKIETEQLEVQKGELRRQLLLLTIEHCDDAKAVREFWKKLDPEEQQDHVIVDKFLYYRGGQHVGEIFGCNPWNPWRNTVDFRDSPMLPESFTTDRNAFLTFVEKGLFKPILPSQLRGYHVVDFDDSEDIPGNMMDDTEVMMVVCAKCPLRFQHASERLQDDEDFVEWSLRVCNSSERECNAFYVSERLQQKLLLDGAQVPASNFPDDFQASQEDIIAFLKYGHGQFNLKNLAGHVPDDLKNDKDCMLHVIANCNGSIEDIHTGFHTTLLSERLQKDEDIVKALLQAGYSDRVEILENAPSLLESREVMMLLLSVESNSPRDHCFVDLVGQCPLLDDDDFILEAYTRDCGTFYYASVRLRSNRDFLDRLVDATQKCNFLQHTTDEFHAEHVDFIVSLINRARHNEHNDIADEEFLVGFVQAFWSNKQAVMACVQKGWPVWEFIERDSPFFQDKEIMFLSVMDDPSTLKSVHSTLQNDREFILRLVQNVDRVLHHAPPRMKYDKEILLTALSRNSGTISDCFDGFKLESDFDFLCEFALEMRTTIATQKSFAKFLGGISLRPFCPLSTLSLGDETDIGLKKKIAEYVGVLFPFSPNLQIRTAALNSMELLGY